MTVAEAMLTNLQEESGAKPKLSEKIYSSLQCMLSKQKDIKSKMKCHSQYLKSF